MIEVRFHGRGGQGAVIGAKVLAIAGFRSGQQVQAFPSFGAERRGAPVTAFTRLDALPLRDRSEVYSPTHVIVLDASLLTLGNLTAGLQSGGWILVNTPLAPDRLPVSSKFRVATVDADAIARQFRLGPPNAPIVNTATLGAFARICDVVPLSEIVQAILEAVPLSGEANAAAAAAAFDRILIRTEGTGVETATAAAQPSGLRVADLPLTTVAPMPGFKGITTGVWRTMRPVPAQRPAPCQLACPAGGDAVGWLGLFRQGRDQEALASILATNPLPGVCGRVCPHPCEANCNRAGLGGAVAIHLVERFLGDLSYPVAAAGATNLADSSVAVVGSGPAGLSCAYFLAKEGARVTIYEAQPQPGGMLRYGIPAYRLPRYVLDRDIERVVSLGVEMRTGYRVTDLTELRRRHGAVFVAIGQGTSRRLGIPGEDAPGVMAGLDLLRQVASGTLGPEAWVGRQVVVIGGGNTALDAARAAVRLGARVQLIYRRSRDAMPAIPAEVDEAIEEGIPMRFQAAPVQVEAADGQVCGLVCQETLASAPDGTGRRPPVVVAGSRFTVPCDTIVAAVGQDAELGWLPPALRGRRGVRSNDQGATVVPGLFFGGDVLTAAGTVAAAIGSGRRAAAQIRSYLLGKAHGSNPRVTDATAVRADDLNLAYLGAVPRVAASSRAPAERCTDFGEVVMGLGEEAARWEAGRCLSCGTCNACDNCFIFCPDAAVMRRPTGPYEFNLTACKGCGICVVECPRGALALVQESRSVTA